jgi:phage terminase small subunit
LAREAGKARALRQLDITSERTMLEIGRVAFTGRASMWKDGRLLPFEQWPADALALLEGFEVVIKNAAAGDGHTDLVHKVHLAKKLGALELLAKHFGLLIDRMEHTGTLQIEWKTSE